MAASGSGGGSQAIRAGRAFVEIFADDNKLYRALGAAQARLKSFGAATAKIGVGLFAGGTAAGAAGLWKVLDSLSDTAKIDQAAKAFGLTAEAASGLFGVLSANGADNARENIESLVTLAGRVKDVMEGTGEESKKLFKGLSVSAQDLAKLPIDEQFFKLHEALLAIPDPMERVNKLMLAYGEDGGKTLIGTLSKSTAELREQAKTFALTGDEMNAARKGQEAYSRATATISTIWRKVATAAAPVVESVADLVTKYLTPVSAWISNNRPLVILAAKAFFGFAAGVAAVGAAMIVLGPVIIGVANFLGGVASVISGVLGAAASTLVGLVAAIGVVGTAITAIGAVIAAPEFALVALGATLLGVTAAAAGMAAVLAAGAAVVAGLTAAFLYLTKTGIAVRAVMAKVFAGDYAGAAEDAAAGLRDAWGSVLEWLDEHFGATFRNLQETWKAVVAAVNAGDLEGAFSLAVDGLRVEWARLMVFFTEKWNGFKSIFVDGWHQATKETAGAWDSVIAMIDRAGVESLKIFAKIGSIAPDTLGKMGINVAAMNDVIGKAGERESQREADKAVRQANFDKDQAARDAARADDLAAAQANLDDEEARAEQRRIDAANRAVPGAAPNAPRPVPGAAAVMNLGKSIGAFGGLGNVTQEFGGGGVLEKQLKVQEKIQKGIDQLVRKPNNLLRPGQVGDLAFD